MLTARDLKTEAPATVGPTASVRSAIEILHALDVRHLPVVNDAHELVGMLSDRDLRALSMPPSIAGPEHVGILRAALDASVASLMSSDVLSLDMNADAAEVVDLMLDHKIGAVPITDADGALVGIISYMDILRVLPLEVDAAK